MKFIMEIEIDSKEDLVNLIKESGTIVSSAIQEDKQGPCWNWTRMYIFDRNGRRVGYWKFSKE